MKDRSNPSVQWVFFWGGGIAIGMGRNRVFFFREGIAIDMGEEQGGRRLFTA